MRSATGVWRRARWRRDGPGRRRGFWSALTGASAEPRRHREERVVPFRSELVYRVVADVPRYAEFVPYTVESRVLERVSERESVAELVVGFGGLSERYLSRVRTDAAARTVEARAENSRLFQVLNNRWSFASRPLDPGSCLLRFELEFKFQSSLHNAVADMFFDKVSESMVDAFLERCKRVAAAEVAQVASDEAEPPPARPPAARAPRSLMPGSKAAILGELETLSHFELAELKRIKDNYDLSLARAGSATGLGEAAFVDLFVQLFAKSAYPAADLQRSARQIFRALDLNRDGALSLHEFTAGLSTVVRGTPEERCRFWFRCYDLDEDGLVDREELQRMVAASVEVRNALLEAGVANKPSPSPSASSASSASSAVPSGGASFRIETDVNKQAREAVRRCFPPLSGSAGKVSRDQVLRHGLF